jgi:hypothetical protein
METFGFSLKVAFSVAGLIVLLGLGAVWWVVRSAPPRTIVITAGPPDSTFNLYAERYAKELAKRGMTLRILPSQGSLENLERLKSGYENVDVGFVQGGLIEGEPPPMLFSLGSVAYQPLLIFYRNPTKMVRLSELAGKKVAIGAIGSGTRALAVALLKANGIAAGGDTRFLDLDAEAAANALIAQKIDAVFLMGDSAPLPTLRTLLREDGIRLYGFAQADAYTRRFAYLNRIVFPEGGIDLGRDLPPENIVLVGPTVELIARKTLRPVLSDMLLEAAQAVHGRASILQKAKEFPAPLEHEFPISDDAKRFYKSGVGIAQQYIRSFWVASMVNRLIVVFVPAMLVLIPTVRFFPVAYRWTNQLRFYRCYRPLLQLEREAMTSLNPEQRHDLLQRLDEMEEAVNKLKVPASFADQFYDLRVHIAFVRSRVGGEEQKA